MGDVGLGVGTHVSCFPRAVSPAAVVALVLMRVAARLL